MPLGVETLTNFISDKIQLLAQITYLKPIWPFQKSVMIGFPGSDHSKVIIPHLNFKADVLYHTRFY
jgi:hypothetical protein